MLPLRDGVTPHHALEVLREVSRTASNVLGMASGLVDKLNAYRKWAAEQERRLREAFDPSAMLKLLQTPRYWVLNGPTDYGPALSFQIESEITERISVYAREVDELKKTVDLWSAGTDDKGFSPSRLHAIILDTNVLEMHAEELATFRWSSRAGLGEGGVGLVVPSIVIDEVDAHKLSNNQVTINGQKRELRALARAALRTLDRLFPGAETRATIDATARPAIYAFLQVNPLEHRALPSVDAEIVAQSLELRPFAESVTLASYDGNICFTAAHYGLRTIRLRYDEAKDRKGEHKS